MHHDREQMLAERLIAQRVLEREARPHAERSRQLACEDEAVVADGLSLGGPEFADAAHRDDRMSCVVAQHPDRLAARDDAPEVGEAVRDGAPALTVEALRDEAVHRGPQVEHEVLADLAARIAEDGAPGAREQAEPRRLDGARREDEPVGARGAARAAAEDVLDGAHVAAVVDQAEDGGVVPQLAAAREQRAAQRRHGREPFACVVQPKPLQWPQSMHGGRPSRSRELIAAG
jgi:hypothetical protein